MWGELRSVTETDRHPHALRYISELFENGGADGIQSN